MRIKLICMLLVLMVSCSMQDTVSVKAENALDAGREYINACLQGDFSLAAAYMVADTANKKQLQQLEAIYRTKDKE